MVPRLRHQRLRTCLERKCWPVRGDSIRMTATIRRKNCNRRGAPAVKEAAAAAVWAADGPEGGWGGGGGWGGEVEWVEADTARAILTVRKWRCSFAPRSSLRWNKKSLRLM